MPRQGKAAEIVELFVPQTGDIAWYRVAGRFGGSTAHFAERFLLQSMAADLEANPTSRPLVEPWSDTKSREGTWPPQGHQGVWLVREGSGDSGRWIRKG